MDDVIFPDISSQENILKKLDCSENKSFGKKNHCTPLSSDGYLFSDLLCKIKGVKGYHVFDKKLISKILSLEEFTDSSNMNMGTSIDNIFFSRDSEGVTFSGEQNIAFIRST